jgi:hypothetical protein
MATPPGALGAACASADDSPNLSSTGRVPRSPFCVDVVATAATAPAFTG